MFEDLDLEIRIKMQEYFHLYHSITLSNQIYEK